MYLFIIIIIIIVISKCDLNELGSISFWTINQLKKKQKISSNYRYVLVCSLCKYMNIHNRKYISKTSFRNNATIYYLPSCVSPQNKLCKLEIVHGLLRENSQNRLSIFFKT